MYLKDGVWYISPNGTSTSHKTLEWAVKWRSHWVIETLVPSIRDSDLHTSGEQHAAIDAELELQRGPKTKVGWCGTCGHTTRHAADGCVKCGMITYHTDRGCVECQEARK